MKYLFLLSKTQMIRTEPFFSLTHGVLRMDNRRVFSGEMLQEYMIFTRLRTTGSSAGANMVCSTGFSRY